MTKIISLSLCLLLFSCTKNNELLFENLDASDSNITFENRLKENGSISILDYLYYYNGGGVAAGDINNDGLVDLYFTSNQGSNELYLNKGNNKFENITKKAGVAGKSDWSTGTVMADVNGDGLLDIYVCAVVGINGFEGHNELFINNGDLTFTESAAEYGLDLDNYSSSAVFFDYDLDGDLDMYLLNHAVHSELNFGNANIRNERNYECGDKLFQNENGKFIDVSEKAGIFGGANGYGLGLAVSDFNLDGYPDIYVCNDFHEDDYYYLNNGDGTFTECLKNYFGHTSRFSMGVDVADINHDGFPDIFSLDMLPEDEKVLKASLGDENVQMLKLRTEKLGYHYQYTRNMLQINQGGNHFTETALQSGVAATDWSWSTLMADFNQDGFQDIFVANGIPKRPNDLDYVKYYSSAEIREKLNTTKLLDKEALRRMPSGSVSNYIFSGGENLKFENKSAKWIENDTLISNGSCYADIDNDGDLDIITNNLNQKASIYSNQTNKTKSYLKINLVFEGKNKFAIGSKAIVYNKRKFQTKELFTARGFQSSSEPSLHFGLNNESKVDSILIIWPDKTYQVEKNVATNKTLTVKALKNRKAFDYQKLHPKIKPVFTKVEDNLGIQFEHKENDYIDFIYQKLIPYQRSDRGPSMEIADINGDGLNDIYFGNSNGNASQIFLQKGDSFIKNDYSFLSESIPYEEASIAIADFNKDGLQDIYSASGGGQHDSKLQDRLFFGKGKEFEKATLPNLNQNATDVKVFDYDNDGDLDLFVGNNSLNNRFGSSPNCYLLKNDNGKFSIVQSEIFNEIGMVNEALVTDFNKDGNLDLILIGEWMKPQFLANINGKFKNYTETVLTQKLNGLWQCIEAFDIDGDGDEDYLLGNWGLNSKFKANTQFPLVMFYDDFDKNDAFETIVAIEKNGKYYTTMGLDELAEQFSGMVKKKFNAYHEFAGKPLDEVIDNSLLQKSKKYEVHELQSGFLRNDKGKFTFVPFSNALQVSPIRCMVKNKFSSTNKEAVFAAGNYFGVSPYHSRFDGFSGALIQSDKSILLGHQIGINLAQKAITELEVITIKNKLYLIVAINNKKAEVYEISNANK